MPPEYQSKFVRKSPFPSDIVEKATAELDNFAAILQREGIEVYRPAIVDWMKLDGYTAAMPRDGLMTVGNTIVEACFAWGCRRHEIKVAYEKILLSLKKDGAVKIVRAPFVAHDTIYDGIKSSASLPGHNWAINNTRPAFDAADFMRFGIFIVGQLSNVTNLKGVEYLRAVIPPQYSVELLDANDPHAMHIDATILPLRGNLLIYNYEKVSEESLRKLMAFQNWELHAYPFAIEPRDNPPLYMTSPWLVMNALSLDENRIMVEAKETKFAAWLEGKFGMKAIMCPFQHVNSIGGSFHCATVDLVRR